MTEIIRLMSEQGELTGQTIAADGSIRIPEGVREVIGRRLNRLSDQCNQVLTTASIIGREFEFGLLGSLMGDIGEDQLLGAVDEASAARLIEEAPNRAERFQFSHALVQQTLAEEVTTTRRVRLHARIGEALEEHSGPMRIPTPPSWPAISVNPRPWLAARSWFTIRSWPASRRWPHSLTRMPLLISKTAWPPGT